MSEGGKNRLKMEVLNLALVRKDDWQDVVLQSSHEIAKEDIEEREGTWLYRAEMVAKFGWEQTHKWIDAGKWEKEEDSDGDSVYKKVTKRTTNRKSRRTSSNIIKTGRGSKEDMEELGKTMDEWFEKHNLGKEKGNVNDKPKKGKKAKQELEANSDHEMQRMQNIKNETGSSKGSKDDPFAALDGMSVGSGAGGKDPKGRKETHLAACHEAKQNAQKASRNITTSLSSSMS